MHAACGNLTVGLPTFHCHNMSHCHYMAIVDVAKLQKFRYLETGALEVTCWCCKAGAISQHSALNMASGRLKICFRSLAKVKSRMDVPVAGSKWIKSH